MKPYRLILKHLARGHRAGGTVLTAALISLALISRVADAASLANDDGCAEAIGNANGGYGFDAWTNVSIGSGGGTYTTSDAGLSSNGCSTAWGIYSGGSAVTTSVQRPFTNYTALSVGQTVSVDLQNGGINSGGSEGISLYNTTNGAAWELYFAGGASDWTIHDNSGATTTTIPYAGSGCRVFFTLTSATTYSVSVQAPVGGVLAGGQTYGPYTGTLISSVNPAITQLRFYTYNIGSGNNLQINNLEVGYDTPTITAQPAAATTTTYGSATPAMTVSAASNDGTTLSYAWRKRGSGWGQAWTFDNTSVNATAFVTASGTTIDTAGKSWGLWQNSGQSSAVDAIRQFPAALAVNETFSLDLANTNVPTGSSVGFSLQDASGNDALEFYFQGGANNYYLHDNSSVTNDSGVGFTSGGLNVKVTLTSSTTYSARIYRYADAKTVIKTGTLLSGAGAIARVRLFDFVSSPDNMYFNNLVVAGADDDAGNYASGWSGDEGQKPLGNGATGTGSTNSGSATASFMIEDAQIADGTNNYDCAVMSGQGYTVISSATALTVNRAGTSVSLASSENPAGFKNSLTFTATLPANATGSVIFQTNSATFDTESLSSGSATSIATTQLPRGTDTVTAEYAGDANYLGSTNSLSQVVTNHPPAAQAMTVVRLAGLPVEIALSDMATNWSDPDGDTVMLSAIGPATTNGVTLFLLDTSTNGNGTYVITNNAYIGYSNSRSVNDQFSYTIIDGYGGTNTGVVNISLSTNSVFGSASASINTSGGSATLSFGGIPGYSYGIQVSSNLTSWTTIWTTNAPANGVFQFIDRNPPQPAAYYRLEWNP